MKKACAQKDHNLLFWLAEVCRMKSKKRSLSLSYGVKFIAKDSCDIRLSTQKENAIFLKFGSTDTWRTQHPLNNSDAKYYDAISRGKRNEYNASCDKIRKISEKKKQREEKKGKRSTGKK